MGLSECGYPLDGLQPSHQRQCGATASLGHFNEPPRDTCGHIVEVDEHANSLLCKQIDER